MRFILKYKVGLEEKKRTIHIDALIQGEIHRNNSAIMRIEKLIKLLKIEYAKTKANLLFHGWHHIEFVYNKTLEFAATLGIKETTLLEAAALTHDLNYLVKKNSSPKDGTPLRKEILQASDFTDKEITHIENMVLEAHTATRSATISREGMILSDADTLFKVLPITPIIFGGKYLEENGINIFQHAEKIIKEQKPLLKKDIYFYTPMARDRYLRWAKHNLALWQDIFDSANDPDIQKLLQSTEK